MMRQFLTGSCLLAFVVALLCPGCAGRRPQAYHLEPARNRDAAVVETACRALQTLYPDQYQATQRAIITVRKRQFVSDGVLRVSPERGHHLAIISPLGLVTEVQLGTNGAGQLVRTTPLFRETWSRNFVLKDLSRLFAPPDGFERSGRLADGRMVLESKPGQQNQLMRYVFSPMGDRLQEVEIAQSDSRVYHATLTRYRRFAGFPEEVPCEFSVVAPSYKLNLRTVEMIPLANGDPKPGNTAQEP